jgi:VanZ family protein
MTPSAEDRRVPLSISMLPSRLFLAFVALLIVALSSQPSLKPPFHLFPHQDKVFHFIEYAGLALALVLNADIFGKRPGRNMFCFGLAWAVADEIHQHFVPGRHCSVLDIAADAAGLMAGILLFTALLRRFSSKEGRG